MHFHYDARHEHCPLPLVKTRQLLKKMNNQDKLTLTINDAGSLSDIPKYLTNHGWLYTRLPDAGDAKVLLISKEF